MIKAVIFDMDGVMIDTETQSTLGWLHASEEHGMEMPMWLIDKFKGAPAHKSEAYFNEYYKGRFDYWQMRKERADYVHLLRRTEGIPVKYGLYMLLEYIRQHKLKCAVATSTQRDSAYNTLHEIGAWSYLDAVVFGDEVEHGKPEPDIFLKAAEAIGVRPEECIVIEDSINGVKAGYAARMKVVHIPDTLRIGPENELLTSAICHNLSEVPAIIEYWNGSKIKIDKDRVKEAFVRYTDAYDPKDERIRLKIEHTYRVAVLCQCIAENMGLSDYDCDIVWLLGMMHDIGRFEQVRRFGTFSDVDSISHAVLGANILFKDGLAEALVPELKALTGTDLWKLLDRAVRYHGDYRLPDELDDRERLFAQILRDADKIDIFKVCVDCSPESVYGATKQAMDESEVTIEVVEAALKGETVLKSLRRSAIDYKVGHISLVYGLVYPESVELAVGQGYLDKLLLYTGSNAKAEEAFSQLGEAVEKYVLSRLGN